VHAPETLAREPGFLEAVIAHLQDRGVVLAERREPGEDV
jgi:hypothetical protein